MLSLLAAGLVALTAAAPILQRPDIAQNHGVDGLMSMMAETMGMNGNEKGRGWYSRYDDYGYVFFLSFTFVGLLVVSDSSRNRAKSLPIMFLVILSLRVRFGESPPRSEAYVLPGNTAHTGSTPELMRKRSSSLRVWRWGWI